MGKIISSYVVPHPPIVVPEVGKGEERGASATVSSFERAAGDIKKDNPTTIILTTPHGPVFQDYIYMSLSDHLKGSLEKFGAPQVELGFQNNRELADRIAALAAEKGIPAGGLDDRTASKYRISKELDHGALVPLYFINKTHPGFKLVHISIAGLPFEELYKFGMCISEAVAASGEQAVFVASGDLSHRLSAEAPYGYSAEGKQFDELLVDSIRTLDVERLLALDESFCESAGECGLRSFVIMLGALDGYEARPEIYSYEGPFGVGYSVARIEVGGEDPGRKVLEKLLDRNKRQMEELRKAEDPYVSLARKTLEAYVREKKVIPVPGGLPEEMLGEKAGTFVSIKNQGQLRGCIGTISPTRDNIAEEIIYNAISAGTRDPRFDPVEPEELHRLVYSVDVLGEPEPIGTMEELDVIRYGVIVRAGRRSGLLLPNLEGVNTPEEQVNIALQKAGIGPAEKYSMERFEVIRHR